MDIYEAAKKAVKQNRYIVNKRYSGNPTPYVQTLFKPNFQTKWTGFIVNENNQIIKNVTPNDVHIYIKDLMSEYWEVINFKKTEHVKLPKYLKLQNCTLYDVLTLIDLYATSDIYKYLFKTNKSISFTLKFKGYSTLELIKEDIDILDAKTKILKYSKVLYPSGIFSINIMIDRFVLWFNYNR